jgi:hypothetical protein
MLYDAVFCWFQSFFAKFIFSFFHSAAACAIAVAAVVGWTWFF